ncbi:hypothetical protein TRFO_32200 [Tritrichomonas foetus]|uniref:Uncharacterized protein n=1 Tax=Tritrichomonas foetus TaxID=1144522 RepID=A0A1J4JP89_9EUKA|nr:hypothetical protein TRFO_32200 [Tritrichomonas foetus]|eukprot:OHT00945.1 hypothetical protein TRFO_32200 [Tritrichomonas foetus]
MEHLLQNKWTFWFILFNHQNQKNSQYQIEEISSVDTVESFLQLFHSLPKIDDIKNVNNKRVSIGLFTQNEKGENIKPAWEDPANSNGGSFNFLINQNISNEAWHNLLLSIIGGTLQEPFGKNDKILGITIGPKKDDQYGIEIWNQNRNTTLVNKIKEYICTIEGLSGVIKPTDISYKAHG